MFKLTSSLAAHVNTKRSWAYIRAFDYKDSFKASHGWRLSDKKAAADSNAFMLQIKHNI